MKCATDIAKWLGEHSLTGDVSIYVDHKRYKVSEEGKLVYDIDAEPKEYFEWAGDFLSMSFEGPLYETMNNYNDCYAPGLDDKRQAEFLNICKKYGKYYELGNAWNLSLYNC